MIFNIFLRVFLALTKGYLAPPTFRGGGGGESRGELLPHLKRFLLIFVPEGCFGANNQNLEEFF